MPLAPPPPTTATDEPGEGGGGEDEPDRQRRICSTLGTPLLKGSGSERGEGDEGILPVAFPPAPPAPTPPPDSTGSNGLGHESVRVSLLRLLLELKTEGSVDEEATGEFKSSQLDPMLALKDE
eukprot:CAMPEP_0175065770 /NCGR_PEP_ID=MMETSP0052_2-20121109/16126_1 /TAXON_ID=51329 ORGANISM="Polytomella parva, Strain SAG 63-3" /NCGR_SAMPLE_ID=MMETSP0052_2 /ASSEMBLY_ACC=CAM_ASM_000194 /LENGTH=122 /DNA_ID=CAMNT_0016332375 /DNA_START=275 /DNA_END=643 /DNA_ORIENTATION=+